MGCRASVILEQPLDIVELELRPHRIGKAAAQLLKNAAGALHVGFAPHLDPFIPPVATPPPPAPGVRGLIGPPPGAAGLSAGGRARPGTLLLQGPGGRR